MFGMNLGEKFTSSERIVSDLDAAAARILTACGDGRMVWRLWGSGPPLLLLHGGHGSWTHWIRTIPALAGQCTVVVPDMPGYGDSDAPPEPATIVGLAE